MQGKAALQKENDMRINQPRMLLSMLVVVLGSVPAWSGRAGAETLTVGGDLACQFRSIQDALDHAASTDGRDVIKVARSKRHTGEALTVIDGNVVLQGGYSRCDDEFPLGHTSVGDVRILGDGSLEPDLRRIQARNVEHVVDSLGRTAKTLGSEPERAR